MTVVARREISATARSHDRCSTSKAERQRSWQQWLAEDLEKKSWGASSCSSCAEEEALWDRAALRNWCMSPGAPPPPPPPYARAQLSLPRLGPLLVRGVSTTGCRAPGSQAACRASLRSACTPCR
jgi:hypothetical protein